MSDASERIWSWGDGKHAETNPQNHFATEYIRLDVHERLKAARETALEQIKSSERMELQALRERDQAIKALSEAQIARGRAEGKLAASELPGVVDGWKARAERAEAERDQALARVAAAFELAAGISVTGEPEISQITKYAIRTLTPAYAQAALDKMLAKAREDANKEISESFRAQIERMRQHVGDWAFSEVPEAINDTLDDVLTLLNDGGRSSAMGGICAPRKKDGVGPPSDVAMDTPQRLGQEWEKE